MPGRLEFETEYENEAEQSVKDMIFNEDDAPEEVGKLTRMDKSIIQLWSRWFANMIIVCGLNRSEADGARDL